MIRLPDGLTVDGLLRRIAAATRAARLLEDAGGAPRTLEEWCQRIEALLRRYSTTEAT